MEGTFWYSEKQKEAQSQLGWGHRNYARLDNGEVVEYTEMSSQCNFKPCGAWDDYKFLGHGVYSHTVS